MLTWKTLTGKNHESIQTRMQQPQARAAYGWLQQSSHIHTHALALSLCQLEQQLLLLHIMFCPSYIYTNITLGYLQL